MDKRLRGAAAFTGRDGVLAFALAEAPFDEPLDVDGAALELPEAEVERMVKIVQVKILGAPLVRTVEERTIVLLLLRHARLTRDTLRHMELSAGGVLGREQYGGSDSVLDIMTSVIRLLLCIVLGAGAFGVSFATRHGAGAVVLMLPCLLLLSRVRSARVALYGGLAAGIALYAPHLIFFVHVFGPAGMLLWVIAAAPIALFVLLIHQSRRWFGENQLLWLAPVLWTGIEFLRAEWNPLRFAWLLPGEAPAFLPGVRLLRVGVYGIGFLIALAASFATDRRLGIRAIGITASLGLVAFMYFPATTVAYPTSDLHVAGIQLEWPSESQAAAALDKLAEAHPEAQLLVLSEYTFHDIVPTCVRDVLKRRHRYLIAGGVQRIDENHFNDTAFVVGPDGQDVFSQGKSVPVQFMDDGLPASARHVWNSPWGKIGIAICYDVSYATVMDDFVREGAEALILPTMDLENWGLYERRMLHGRMALVRSAEYGIPTFSVWSSGESQLVDRAGHCYASADYPGPNEMIAGPLELRGPGHVPPDRWLAMTCVAITAIVVLNLTILPILARCRPARA